MTANLCENVKCLPLQTHNPPHQTRIPCFRQNQFMHKLQNLYILSLCHGQSLWNLQCQRLQSHYCPSHKVKQSTSATQPQHHSQKTGQVISTTPHHCLLSSTSTTSHPDESKGN